MKPLFYTISLCVLCSFESLGAFAQSRFIAMPDTTFRVESISPTISSTTLSWPKSGSAYPIDIGVWSQGGDQHQWGIEYLVDAFNLANYQPSRDSVFVVQGRQIDNNKRRYRETTHYIYHPDKTRVCLVHFQLKWELTASSSSYSSIKSQLLGCHSLIN